MNYFAVGHNKNRTKVVLVKSKSLVKAKRAIKRLAVHGYDMVGPVASRMPDSEFWSGHHLREKFIIEDLTEQAERRVS